MNFQDPKSAQTDNAFFLKLGPRRHATMQLDAPEPVTNNTIALQRNRNPWPLHQKSWNLNNPEKRTTKNR